MRVLTEPDTLNARGLPSKAEQKRLLGAADLLTAWGTIERGQESGTNLLTAADNLRIFVRSTRQAPEQPSED